jgi:hypothetical protein
MYLRFETLIQNDTSSSKLGIFNAAYQLRNHGDITSSETKELNSCFAWFDKNLEAPDCINDDDKFRYISWFKPQAKEHIKHVRRIVSILEEHGVIIKMIKTKNPGQIIYADDWQVFAKPQKG